MERIIMHIDVNNAFLSWSAIDFLEKGYSKDIRDTYSIIGGSEERRSGIVLAKSPLAKKIGIKTAETIYQARKKCPGLEIYPPNYSFYYQKSQELFNLLAKYTPDIEVASIDECFIDYGKVKKLYGDELLFAQKIQNEIFEKLKFTVNIGIGNNKLCAKMASDFSKPNKIHTLYDHELKVKMYPLNVEDLYGVGKSTTDKLKTLNINTIEDLANTDLNLLKKYFKNMSLDLKNRAMGIDYSEVVSERDEPQGIGMEVTLVKDEIDRSKLLKILFSITDIVSRRLRREKKYVNTVVVVIKTFDFKKKSHQKKLVNPTNITDVIYQNVRDVFGEFYDGTPIRLIGIRLTNLSDKKIIQTSIFDKHEEEKVNEKIDDVIDKLKKKYGNSILTKASLIDKNRK